MNNLTKEELENKQVEYYFKAFNIDSDRRESLIKLAFFYKSKGRHRAVVTCCEAALTIPFVDYYANDKAMYEHLPHELLYSAYGWLGDKENAQKHLLKALEYQPYNTQYLKDTFYHFEYPANFIEGWFTYPEQKWCYDIAKQLRCIGEGGSWMGRSTNAFATGMGSKGKIYAIDTWEGSDFVGDDTNWMAKQQDVFAKFKENTKQFTNIEIDRCRSVEAATHYQDKTFDAFFIDMGHTYEDVKADIEAWLPKTKMIICGHDYMPNTWQGVIEAVDEKFGKPDGLAGTVWYKYLVPRVTFIVPTLGRPEGLKRCLDSIKALNYPQELIDIVVLDGEGTVPQKVARGLWQAKGEYIVFASNDVEFTPDSLYNALQHKKGLVAFNTGDVSPDAGNINEHFIIQKSFIDKIGGEIFDTEFHHIGCDNLLYHKANKLGEFERADDAVVYHYHWSKVATQPNDEVYAKGWSHVAEDRALLEKKLKEIYDK